MIERIEVFNRDDLICIMFVDSLSKTIEIQNQVAPEGLMLYLLPFGCNLHPTWQEYKEYLSERCFESSRPDKVEILKSLGVPYYDPALIVRATHGVMNDDYVWLRFPGETLTFKDVQVRP